MGSWNTNRTPESFPQVFKDAVKEEGQFWIGEAETWADARQIANHFNLFKAVLRVNENLQWKLMGLTSRTMIRPGVEGGWVVSVVTKQGKEKEVFEVLAGVVEDLAGNY